MASTSKQWKEHPPGAEQKELNRMFANNIIEEHHSPNDVRKMNPMFLAFSTRVFAAHFRKTKAKNGIYTQVGENKENQAESSVIPELGSNDDSTTSRNFINNFDCLEQNKENELIQLINFPATIWTHCDHDESYDIVNVAVPIISGSKNINFSLSENGKQVSINYSWPTSVFRPSELFEKEILLKEVSTNDPKVHALKTHLLTNGITEKSNPIGQITLTLPIEVQREAGSWKKKAIKKADGTQIVLLEFKGYQQNRIIEDADTSICF